MLLTEISFDFSNISIFTIIIALVGYVIVFGALVVLYWIFNSIPKLININIRRQLRKQGKNDDGGELNIEGNIAAAIALALHLHLSELHDEESSVITIKRISRQYAPWSSKIYSTNSFFRIVKQ
ncbi:MAG TPA: OadG family transporter subunit [Bacteroidales bacterium]|nr:OadG family transporter subunit [Bacteroidales bacterium]HPR58309.1 OadG family transporter subunit [Bacteroidales bacterium]HRW96364.1 OadG family transporter subunit [Bacteroidales bacterium]